MYKGPSIKDVRTKSRKINPSLLVRKMSALAQPPFSPCSCGHTINFEKSDDFCTKKCGRPHLKNPLPPCNRLSQSANVFYGQPLISILLIVSIDKCAKAQKQSCGLRPGEVEALVAILHSHCGYLHTCLKNDVISSVQKHYCALGLGLGLELGLGRVSVRAGVSVITFSIKRVFEQV